MSRQNLYKEDISVSDDLSSVLKKYLLNHLVLYNHTLEVLEKTPNIKFKDLKKIIYNYIIDKQIKEYISSCLYNEIYYLYKKYINNVKSQKCLTDIQYLTFYVNSYNNKNFNLVDNKIIFKNIEGHIELNKKLPELDENELFYFNISYSNNENKYQLSIYK